ncbi:MAG: molybdopterin molybdenumtransferase MoeA [Thermoprotei archaeon]|nr:MAG: molybdopterin molybdenumtransferase MoeA [Thermoprotei archaeon]
MFFKKLLRIKEAWKIIRSILEGKKLPTEKIEIDQALGRYIAEDLKSNVDIPTYDKSAVDGFAVRSAELTGASLYNPALLKIIGKSTIGSHSELTISEGEAIKIDTGAPLPKGADAVVELESCSVLGEYVEITKRVAPFTNVIRKGEDVKKGEVIMEKGSKIEPWHIALLKGVGIEEINVYIPPRVALISTGSELSSSWKEGKMVDTNKPNFKNLLKLLSINALDMGIVKDDRGDIRKVLEKACEVADIIVTTGGVSVGERDYTIKVLEEMGEIYLHGVAVRPGMPFAFARIGDVLVFALPGNPVAAYVDYKLFVELSILQLYNAKLQAIPVIAKLEYKVPSSLGFKELIRVKLIKREDVIYAVPVRRRGSSILSSITRSDGVIAIPEDCEGMPGGTVVKVYLHTQPWTGIIEE